MNTNYCLTGYYKKTNTSLPQGTMVLADYSIWENCFQGLKKDKKQGHREKCHDGHPLAIPSGYQHSEERTVHRGVPMLPASEALCSREEALGPLPSVYPQSGREIRQKQAVVTQWSKQYRVETYGDRQRKRPGWKVSQ